eukprot:TRINITY_DN11848_c0_g1_i1.p1 TRINITY_DN11848_c0_g1~~TRINITY_DN11848_c0_g1_i1.p1  ORF type:complete len:239 (-),score=28.03 TRINITY_DN11848_c0_g1_i1:72-788(-)
MATAVATCPAVASLHFPVALAVQNRRGSALTGTHCCFLTGGLRQWQQNGRISWTGVVEAKCRLRGRGSRIVCGISDYIGGDLLGFDLGKWSRDVEEHRAIAIYPPAEGGYEGRYATKLKAEGYHFLDLSARGLGDLEAYLTKIHGVRPAHLGKQAIARFYLPPEIDYRLAILPKTSKGLVLWLIEAHVLSKSELQFLVLLPTIRPQVKVIAEVGTWRKFSWKPLSEVAGPGALSGLVN